MADDKPGPERGSEGARKIAEAHRGSHEHDKEGGFAANPELAKEAGRKGGEAVKKKYGPSFYRQIGKKGGETVKQERGSEFYAEIGRRGGEMRSSRMKQRREEEAQEEKKGQK
ncbi:MAG: KGG domain-containing protein [Armatimonadota bacterium]